jgi:hypothetical protein
MATIGGANTVTDGLVLALDAANPLSYPGSGTTWRDLSGNGNNGTLISGSAFNSGNGGSIQFDGSDDYVNVINPTNVSSAFTLNFWIKAVGVGSVGNTGFLGIINRFNGYSSQRNRFLLQNNFRGFYFQPIVGGVSYDIFSNSFSSIQNKISMCSVTYNGSLVSFYLNGDGVGTSSLSGTLDSGSSGAVLGWGADSADYYFNGNIYSAQIYNRALSSSEIQQNYNAVKTRFGL